MNIKSLNSSCNDIMYQSIGKLAVKNHETNNKSIPCCDANKSKSISFDDDPLYQSLRADIRKIKDKINDLEKNLSMFK